MPSMLSNTLYHYLSRSALVHCLSAQVSTTPALGEFPQGAVARLTFQHGAQDLPELACAIPHRSLTILIE